PPAGGAGGALFPPCSPPATRPRHGPPGRSRCRSALSETPTASAWRREITSSCWMRSRSRASWSSRGLGWAVVVVADPFADDAAGQLADLMRVGDAVGGRQGQGFLDPGQDLAESGVVDARAASLDLGAGHHLARVGVDHDHDRDEALVAQDAAVLELGFGDLADGEAVHVDVAARHRAGHAGLAADQVDDDAILGDDDVV